MCPVPECRKMLDDMENAGLGTELATYEFHRRFLTNLGLSPMETALLQWQQEHEPEKPTCSELIECIRTILPRWFESKKVQNLAIGEPSTKSGLKPETLPCNALIFRSLCLFFLLLKFQTPVTLSIGEFWSILVDGWLPGNTPCCRQHLVH